MTSTENLEEILVKISDATECLSLEEFIHVIGYSLIERGISHVQNAPDEIKIEDIPELLIKHKKKHGQDLPTALVQQGLVMAMWISQNKT
jgi:hypothetical protein